MARPKVICHMVPSLDGRIVIDQWPVRVERAYAETAQELGGDAWVVGRVSMEPYAAGKARIPTRRVKVPREDFVAPHEADSYAIAVDPSGKLRWEKADIDGEHVVTVLTEQVPDAYLAFLRERGVSYVFGGKREVDLHRVLEVLRERFGIRTLLLEGGGKINGSFLAAGLVDELSILVAPVLDGSVGTPTLFDAPAGTRPRKLTLRSVEQRKGGIVWLRYRVK